MDAVFGAWYGGSNYAAFTLPRDLERFDSITDASTALYERASASWPVRFNYCNRPPETALCPLVDGCEMHVWLSDPTDRVDAYPDYIIHLEGDDPVIERA